VRIITYAHLKDNDTLGKGFSNFQNQQEVYI
jgi:hypothetical protein